MKKIFSAMFLVLTPFLLSAAPAMGGAGAKQPFMPTLLFFGFLFIIFYVLFIAPQRKQQRRHEEVLKALKPGDRVVTKSGIKGIISQARDGEDFILLKVAEGVKLEILRGSVDNKLETPTGQ